MLDMRDTRHRPSIKDGFSSCFRVIPLTPMIPPRTELVTKEKEDAEEEALLSKSLCTGSTMLP